MGIRINLNINLLQIKESEWEEAFDKTLYLLQAFPLPLMRKTHKRILNEKCGVFTKKILVEEGEKTHWAVIGDLTSYRRGDSFVLYRNKNHYNTNEIQEEKDVLWSEIHQIDCINGNGFDVFDMKTQGYPYHYAILAVGIFLENKFPQSVHVNGDIYPGQVIRSMQWLETIFPQQFTLPLCCNAVELYRRIKKSYSDEKLAMERFQTLCRNTNQEQIRVIAQETEKKIIINKFSNDLLEYNSLSTIGASEILFQLISAIKDIREVVEVVQQLKEKEDKEEFFLEDLLMAIVNNFATIPKEDREFVDCLANPTLSSVEDQFSYFMFKINKLPPHCPFYLSSQELLEIFLEKEPEQKMRFEKIIRRGEKECRQRLEELKKMFEEEMEKKIRHTSSMEKTQEEPTKIKDEFVNMGTNNKYLVDNDNLHQSIKNLNKRLQECFDEDPKALFLETTKYIKTICKASFESGIALRESAWDDIAQETNHKKLQYLLLLSLINNREIGFWHLRIYIMEHPNLWPELSETLETCTAQTK